MADEISNKELSEQIEGLREDITEHILAVQKELREFKNEAREEFAQLKQRTFPRQIDKEDLEARVKYVEEKLGIESGK